MHSIKYYICDCNGEKYNWDELSLHFIYHGATKLSCPFSCGCPEFGNRNALYGHIKRIHSAEMGVVYHAQPNNGKTPLKLKQTEVLLEKIEEVGISKHYFLLKKNFILAYVETIIRFSRWCIEVLKSWQFAEGTWGYIWLGGRTRVDHILQEPAFSAFEGTDIAQLAFKITQRFDEEGLAQTYVLSNVVLQTSPLNRGIWKSTEKLPVKLMECGWDELTILTIVYTYFLLRGRHPKWKYKRSFSQLQNNFVGH